MSAQDRAGTRPACVRPFPAARLRAMLPGFSPGGGTVGRLCHGQRGGPDIPDVWAGGWLDAGRSQWLNTGQIRGLSFSDLSSAAPKRAPFQTDSEHGDVGPATFEKLPSSAAKMRKYKATPVSSRKNEGRMSVLSRARFLRTVISPESTTDGDLVLESSRCRHHPDARMRRAGFCRARFQSS